MALSNVGSLVLHLLIFITTLVNFSYALTSLEPLMLLALYAISKIFVTAPEEGIFAKCQHRNLYEPYQDGWSGSSPRTATNLPASQRAQRASLVILLAMAHTWLERGGELAEVGRHLLELRVLRLGTMLAEAMQI